MVLSGLQKKQKLLRLSNKEIIPCRHSKKLHWFCNLNKNAFEASGLYARKEGMLVGILSGALAHAAIEIAKRDENTAITILVLLPDAAVHYFSKPQYQFD
jgi:cysteine synthase